MTFVDDAGRIVVTTPNKAYGAPVQRTIRIDEPVAEEAGRLLRQLITEVVAPESWTEAGGSGTITFDAVNHELTVYQRSDLLDQVQGLLDALTRLQNYNWYQQMRSKGLSRGK